MDYSVSFLDEKTIEYLDGFLLGDGNISPIHNEESIKSARCQCHLEHEEFCKYMMEPFASYKAITASYASDHMKSGICWQGRTKFHPDLYRQYQRWYRLMPTGKYFKTPPNDVRITPRSVMLWYLGDGSLVDVNNSLAVRLSTDGFSPESVEFLATKLQAVGIQCHRNNDNRIFIEAKGVPAFFDFIGRKSPVKCYDYKFDLPEWRFSSKRLSEVASDLGISYNRLSHLIKQGRVGCFRASENGRPRMLPEHIEVAKELIKSGELY